ncbi:MAG: guanylate kinase [Xanthomonadales bacterium]|nr:guanylate kinase [Xanthomonadales bacterium]
MNKPKLFVVAAPSGGGKTSLIQALLDADEGVRLSVSYTTRPPRPGERDGVHYHFIDEDLFSELVARDAFLEYASVFDHRYGTSRETVEHQLRQGHDVILDIDWQGARQIRISFPACVSVFILPPSLETLRRRLENRGQDSNEVIEKRMQRARAEIAHWDEFDFLIVNDDFGEALADLQSIIHEGKLQRRDQEKRYVKILADLLENG